LIKGPGGQGILTSAAQGLDHGNHKVLVGVADALLDTAYGGTRTELLDAISPLVRQELFVDHDESPEFQMCRKSQGHACLSLARREGKYTPSMFFECLDSGQESFRLSLSQFSNKIEAPTTNRRLSGILGGGTETLESPVPWDK
jgi:hypothetical protein